MISYSTFKKLKLVVSRKEKFLILISFILMFIGTFLELLGISMVIPIISSAVNSSQINSETSQLISSIKSIFYDFSIKNLLIIFFVTFLTKNIYLLFCTKFNLNLSVKIRNRLVSNIYSKYLSQQLNYFSNKHSSEMIRNIIAIQDIGLLISNYLNLLLELLVFFGLFIFLFLVNTKYTIIIFLFFLILVILINKFTKKKLIKFGNLRQFYEKNINKFIIESLYNIKLIKIRNQENFFVKKFSQLDFSQAKLQKNVDYIFQFPKVVVEIFSLGFICSIILFNSSSDKFIDFNTLSYLAILVAILIRLMPSSTRIASSIQRIRVFEPRIDLVFTEYSLPFNLKEEKIKNIINFEKLEMKDVFFGFTPKKIILKNINLIIKKNTLNCFAGTNGSGKTTILNLILGLLTSNKGEILYNDCNIKECSPKISYVEQKIHLIDNSIRENIVFGSFAKKFNKYLYKKSLIYSGLNDFVLSLPSKDKTLVGENGSKLSGGQIQKIGIARAIYSNSDIIVLDEFDNNLDKKSKINILKYLQILKKKHTIIVISHTLNNIKFFDNFFLIKNLTLKKIK